MDEPQVRACSGVTAETRASLRHLRDAVDVDAAAIALERTELLENLRVRVPARCRSACMCSLC